MIDRFRRVESPAAQNRWTVQSGLSLCLIGLLAASVGSGTPEPGHKWLSITDQQLSSAIASSCSDGDAAIDRVRAQELLLQGRLRQRSTDSASAAWKRLACLRVDLYRRGSIARLGLEMSLGDSWYLGAVRALARHLGAGGNDPGATNLLGALIEAEPNPLILAESLTDSLSDLLLQSMRASRPVDRWAARGCWELARRIHDPSRELICARTALKAGIDSTWQLIATGRAILAMGDSGAVVDWMHRAIDAAHSEIDWDSIEWHLSWFLTPAELTEFDSLPRQDRVDWIATRIAQRDLRDGRTLGHRWIEHFRRLAIVDSEFRLNVTRTQQERFNFAASPVSGLRSYDAAANYWEPGLIAARPFREYRRSHPAYDDRGHVYMRYGKPAERKFWSSRDTTEPKIKEHKIRGPINIRETWLYNLRAGPLIVSFEAEQFAGSTAATRLVTGVLGSYFCDLDSYRCGLSLRAASGGISRERMEDLAIKDHSLVATATKRDAEADPDNIPIRIVATQSRLFRNGSAQPLLLTSYAIKLKDLATIRLPDGKSGAIVHLSTLQYHDGSRSLMADTTTRRVVVPARIGKDDYLTGVIVGTAIADHALWSVKVEQSGDHAGWITAARSSLSDSGGLGISDIVVGARSQGEFWTTAQGDTVVLGPLGAFNYDEPISLFWQVRSRSTHPDGKATMIFRKITDSGAIGRSLLQLAFPASIETGITSFSKDVDLRTLGPGSYQLEILVESNDSTGARSASARLLLK